MESSQAQMKTVLGTGGWGFLGGWCVVELLRGGYRVRTTVRALAREAEVRAGIGPQVDAKDRLTVLAADLRSDDGWEQAVEGCDYVLHVASPFPAAQPKDPDELIVPAREGTLPVLKTALDLDVDRVVVPSPVAPGTGGAKPVSGPLTERDWSDPNNLKMTPYARSKTIAERAALDFIREQGATEKLATVNPGAIIGPVLSDDRSYSLQAIERLLGGMPGLPRIGFSFVDVRDVADLQMKAMTAPEAGGERFIATAEFLWMSEVAAVLRGRLRQAAAKVPKRGVPDLLVRAMSIFDPGIRSIVGQLGRKTELSSEKAKDRLGLYPLPTQDPTAHFPHCLHDSLMAKPRAW